MKISIITVCFNAQETIEDTLKSVLSQDYPELEYIVIDGGSRDATCEIISRYRDRLAHCVSEPDRGIYDAMNKGIRLASGEIIGLLNADDIYADSGVISRAVAAMQKDALDAVYADVVFFRPQQPQQAVRRYRSSFFHPRLLGWGWMPAHPTLFLRRNVYEKYGEFRTDMRIASDYEFIARIFKDRSLNYRYIPEVWVRMRTGGISTGGLRSSWLLNREVLRACRLNGIRTCLPMLLSKYPLKLLEIIRR